MTSGTPQVAIAIVAPVAGVASEPSGGDVRPRRPQRTGRTGRHGLAAYAFMLPAIVMFVAFMLLPIIYAVVLSLHASRVRGGLIGRRKEIFVGLSNYRTSLADSEFWHGVVRTLFYGAVVIPIMLGLALLFALLLDSLRVRLAAFTRLAIFLPYAVPGVIASLLWGFLYLPGVSPFRDAASRVGIPAPNFFGTHSIFGSVANIAIWGGVGFNMIVLYTALRAMPYEIYDAARVDGCSEFQLVMKIKIPLLRPAIVMTSIFSIIATLQVFSEPTTLRPLTNAISSTWVPLMGVYQKAFVDGDVYSASATSVLLAAISLVLSLGVLRILQKQAFGEDS